VHEPTANPAPETPPAPAAQPCAWVCGRPAATGRGRRRGLCGACYAKARRCGLRMPAMAAPGPAPWTRAEHLAAWAARLAPDVRAEILAALQATLVDPPDAVDAMPTVSVAELCDLGGTRP
jgi:hypothetical protein